LPYLTDSPLRLDPLLAGVARADRGGIVTFLGLVRDHHDGRKVVRLEYSAYQPMAEAECARIVDEASERWPVGVALEHRLGPLAIGDASVAIVVAGAHRSEAFEACRYIIEAVKQRVPIWKKEYYADGSVAWVDPTASRSVAGETATPVSGRA
jgi:molybdopterin synthase catalytic subunit